MMRGPRRTALLVAGLAMSLASGPIAQAQSSYALHGLNFSPYMDGQDPSTGSVVTEAQVRARMEIIAPFTKWVRSFGTTNGLEHVPPVARSLGLSVAAGAWVDSNASATLAQINSLIARAQAGQVDIAIVGNETQHFNRVTEAKLIEYITMVRQAIPAGIPVATVDTSNALLAHPNVIAVCDVVMVTIYPYWTGVARLNAVGALAATYQQVVAAAGGKPVIVAETGWPNAGNTIGAAVPSPRNASAYFIEFVSWARRNSVASFYFEAFDETWKASYEGPQGAHWGVWDKHGVIRPGMPAGLGQRRVADFDGDGWADRAVFRPDAGVWHEARSDGSLVSTPWGLSTDIEVPADFDDDGTSDVAVWRPDTGTWYVRRSATGAIGATGWGVEGDVPRPGDVDGDGKTDEVVWRPTPGIWYARLSGGGTRIVPWGLPDDRPLIGDWDGDGAADFALWRPSTGVWHIRYAAGGSAAIPWGSGAHDDRPIVGDWDGDRRADVAIWRPSTGQWYVLLSSGGVTIVTWGSGALSDEPIAGDFDGDGRTDFTIWRPGDGVWYTRLAATGSLFMPWGLAGDRPIGGVR